MGVTRTLGPTRFAAGVAALAITGVLAGCAGSSGKTATLNWYIFPEPSGSFAAAAQQCSAASHGAYQIAIQTLSSDADSQRTQLVRRLAAKDPGIDIIGMDVTWTPEFSQAGWIRP
jgi:multiple sugar transport system substrate-binding protein